MSNCISSLCVDRQGVSVHIILMYAPRFTCKQTRLSACHLGLLCRLPNHGCLSYSKTRTITVNRNTHGCLGGFVVWDRRWWSVKAHRRLGCDHGGVYVCVWLRAGGVCQQYTWSTLFKLFYFMTRLRYPLKNIFQLLWCFDCVNYFYRIFECNNCEYFLHVLHFNNLKPLNQ